MGWGEAEVVALGTGLSYFLLRLKPVLGEMAGSAEAHPFAACGMIGGLRTAMGIVTEVAFLG